MGADRLIRNEPITVNGFSGREIEFQAKETGWHTARVIVADTRVYLVIGGGGMAQPNDSDVRRFLNSFEITEPELVKEGKRREEQAKLAAAALLEAKERTEKAREEREAEQKRRDDARHKADAEREASDLRGAAETIAGAALARVTDDARRKAEAEREASDLRGAAEKVAGAALARAARDARPPAPPLEVAPPPRPVEE
jgi:hypothetical protein